MGLTGGKYFIKIIFDVQIEIRLLEVLDVPSFKRFMSIFNIVTNLGPTGGKYLIKNTFDIKTKIGIFEISNVTNFNKFRALLKLGPIWALQVVNI